MVAHKFLSFIIIVFLGGCATKSIQLPQHVENNIVNFEPFKLEVDEVVNDGKSLVVSGKISSQVDWSGEGPVIVRLAGIIEGEEGAVTFSRLLEDRVLLKQGGILPFALSIPATNLSDYQIELLWGEEAKDLGKGVISASAEPRLVISDAIATPLPVTCAEDLGCPKLFQVQATVTNSGEIIVNQLVLGVVLVDLNTANPLTEEDKLEFENIGLVPGQQIPLELEVTLPYLESEIQVSPILRIINSVVE